MTIEEFNRRLDRFRAQRVPTVKRALTTFGREVQRLILSKYMERLGKGAPAYPPPGPLGIRTGRLARSIAFRVDDKPTLYITSDQRHAGIHEFGGIIAHPGSSKPQAWKSKEGKWVFARKGTKPHPIPIRARPYAHPALAQAAKESLRRILLHAYIDQFYKTTGLA